MKYVAYIRKSSKEKNRQAQSIPKQYAWVKRKALERSLDIIHYFEDSQSAHKRGRHGFSDMMEFIEKSKEPLGLICWKISRLARNPMDEGRFKQAFLDKKVKHIIARDREYDEHANHIVLGVDFGQATQYSVELSEDVTEGMEKKSSKGHRPNKAPLGYMNEPNGLKGERRNLIDPDCFEAVKELFDTFLIGVFSVPELQREINKKWTAKTGQPPIPLSSLYRTLKNPYYAGVHYWKGEIRQNEVKPMISWEEHQRILALLSGKRENVASKKYDSHLKGVFTCQHCGSAITGYVKKKKLKNGEIACYNYLKCTKKKDKNCPQRNINRDKIDQQIKEILAGILLSPILIDYFLSNLEKDNQEEERRFINERGRLQARYNTIEGELEELTRNFIKRIIRKEMFEKLQQELEEERMSLRVRIDTYENNKGEWICQVKELLAFSSVASKQYENGDTKTKKLIIRTIGSNFLIKDGKAIIALKIPYKALKEANDFVQSENIKIELSKSRSQSDIMADLDTYISVWSSLWEVVRTTTVYHNKSL